MANMFNEDGTYNKTEWKAGDKITAAKLNKIELSLEAINNNDINRHVEADTRLDDLEENIKNSATKNDLKTLETLVKDNKDATDLEFHTVENHIDTVEGRVNTVEGRVDTVEGRVDTVEGRVDTVEGRVDTVEGRVENNRSSLDVIKRQLRIDITNFGAVGDGVTDNTDAIQAAIDSIDTYKMSTYFKPSTSSGESAVIFIPSGKYIVKGSIRFKGGITFKGEGFNSIIQHRPKYECNLFEADPEHFTYDICTLCVIWEDLTIEGDYDPTNDVGNSMIGIDLDQCGLTRINRCFICFFKTGIYSNCDENHPGGYYNVLTSSSLRSCKLSLDLGVDQYTVTDTNIAIPPNNIAIDYGVKISGGGISITNCAVEGQVNKALYYIAGPGTSINGGYSEANRNNSYYAEIDISKLKYGGVEINALFTNPRIKFLNLYSGVDFTTSYPMSTGIKINTLGIYMPDVITNGSFTENSDNGWTKHNDTYFTSGIVGADQMFNKRSYKMTKVDGTTSFSIRQQFVMHTPYAFVTCMVKMSDDAIPFLAVYDETEVLKNMVRLADYTPGNWKLYGVWIPVISKGRAYTVALGLDGSSPINSTIEVTNIGVYKNGIDYFPSN